MAKQDGCRRGASDRIPTEPPLPFARAAAAAYAASIAGTGGVSVASSRSIGFTRSWPMPSAS